MLVNEKFLRGMSDDYFRAFALAVIEEAARRCLLVVSDETWELCIIKAAAGEDEYGPKILMQLEK